MALLLGSHGYWQSVGQDWAQAWYMFTCLRPWGAFLDLEQASTPHFDYAFSRAFYLFHHFVEIWKEDFREITLSIMITLYTMREL